MNPVLLNKTKELFAIDFRFSFQCFTNMLFLVKQILKLNRTIYYISDWNLKSHMLERQLLQWHLLTNNDAETVQHHIYSSQIP